MTSYEYIKNLILEGKTEQAKREVAGNEELARITGKPKKLTGGEVVCLSRAILLQELLIEVDPSLQRK